MNKPTWKKRIAVGVMSVALLGGAFHTGNELQQSQNQIADEVGAAKATNFSKATYQTTHNLNLRTGASTKHRIQLTIPKGGKVTSTSRIGNWYKVSYKGKTGYVSGSYLKKVTSTSTSKPASKPSSTVSSSKSTYQTTHNLNMRTGASVKYKRILTIPKGGKVTTISKHGSWFKVKYGSKTGYVSGSYLKQVTSKPTPSKPSKPAPKPGVTQKKVSHETTHNLNMRTGASVKYKRILTIPKGGDVAILSKHGSWYKVSYKGKTGYVSGAYLKKLPSQSVSKPTPKPTPKPTTKPSEPTKVTYKVMTRAEGEKHLSKWMDKNGSNFELKVADGAVTPVVVKLTDSKTARGTLMLDVVSYMSMNEAKPEHFGMEDYLGQKKDLAVVNSTIKAFAETQFGVNTPETRRVIAELQKSYKYDENINKTITLQGKKVQLNGGIGSFELTVL